MPGRSKGVGEPTSATVSIGMPVRLGWSDEWPLPPEAGLDGLLGVVGFVGLWGTLVGVVVRVGT